MSRADAQPAAEDLDLEDLGSLLGYEKGIFSEKM